MEFKKKYDLSDNNDVKKMITENESGLYSSVNEDGESVIVRLDQSRGCVIDTNQSNGWIRFDEYDKRGYLVSQGYHGRWR